jgi:site-specific DNA-methyltransferase (adenine-specific)
MSEPYPSTHLFSTHDTCGKESAEVRRQDAVELLASLPEGSVACVLTDPPYGISYQSNRSVSAGKSKPVAGDWNFDLTAFLDECARVLRPDGCVWVFTRWDVYPLWCRSIPPTLKVQNFVVWVKDNHTAGDLTGNLGYKWEGVMLLSRAPSLGGRLRLRSGRMANVWEFARVPHARMTHPTEKPIALLRQAIVCFTDPGDLVVDPFCGSGSTGEAALESGRRVLLGDIDPEYIQLARKRVGLPVEEVPPAPIREVAGDIEADLSLLEGVHPEELRALVDHLRALRSPA